MARPRLTLVRIDVDASWSSLLWALAMAVACIGVALWWVGG